jgi:hypothetical protein
MVLAHLRCVFYVSYVANPILSPTQGIPNLCIIKWIFVYKVQIFSTPVSVLFNFNMFIYIQKKCQFMIKLAIVN